jgi:tetratricopeptide (TPR) repeat protein
LESSGKFNEAVDHYREALRLQPDHAASHCNLGRLLASRGDLQAAATHYETAIELDPRLPEAYSNLGTLLISFGHTRAAIEHFKQALRLRADSTAHFNLAVGYAHDGRMLEATAMARKAIALARAEGNEALAEQFEAALASHPQTSP